MGGSGSKRTLIVENEDGGTVKISEGVVRRLKGLPDEKESDAEAVQPPPPPKSEPPPLKESEYPGLYPKKLNAELEDLYVQKLKDLQERHAELTQKTSDQFKKAVEEVENKFLDYTASPVCQDLQTKVLQCYQANGKEPLQCAALVRAFSSCVEHARVGVHSSDDPLEVPHSKDRYNMLRQKHGCQE